MQCGSRGRLWDGKKVEEQQRLLWRGGGAGRVGVEGNHLRRELLQQLVHFALSPLLRRLVRIQFERVKVGLTSARGQL